MDWWETDPYLNSKAAEQGQNKLKEENEQLQKGLEKMEGKLMEENRI